MSSLFYTQITVLAVVVIPLLLIVLKIGKSGSSQHKQIHKQQDLLLKLRSIAQEDAALNEMVTQHFIRSIAKDEAEEEEIEREIKKVQHNSEDRGDSIQIVSNSEKNSTANLKNI